MSIPTNTSQREASQRAGRAVQLIESMLHAMKVVAVAAAPPVLRVALALPFLRSGLTRWDGFLSLSPSAAYLFSELFRLHIFGAEIAFPFPIVVAHLVGTAEIVLPILLLLGLATRFTAFGLLLMTGVIQLVVPDGWMNFHLYWASIALAIIALGGGPLSLDWLVGRFMRRRTSDTLVS